MTPNPTGESPAVARAAYPDLGGGTGPAPIAAPLDRLAGVELTVAVELGRARMRMRELLHMGEGSVVDLDRSPDAPVDILVNGSLIARGEVVVVGDELGVRITEFLQGQA